MIFQIEFELPHGSTTTETIDTFTMSDFDAVYFVKNLQNVANLMGGDVIGATKVDEDGNVISTII